MPRLRGSSKQEWRQWVLANIPHGYGQPFRLQDALAPLTPMYGADDFDVYDVSGVATFDVPKLVHFGVSVFWRGTVRRWKSSSGQEAPRVDLQEHEEGMRKFVLGTEPLPSDLLLTIDIWPYKDVHQVIYPVITDRSQDCPRYWFYVPGIFFSLYVGPRIPPGQSI